jgi:hypothetical protein
LIGLFSKPGNVYRDGKNLVVTDATPLPRFCVKCGQPVVTEPGLRKYSWHNRWLYLLIFVGVIFYIIVALAVRKRWMLALPLCEAHRKEYRRRRSIGAALLIAGIPIMLLLIGLASSDAGTALGIVTGIGVLLAGAVFWSLSQPLVPTRIEDTFASFTGAGEAFLSQLPGSRLAEP